jgi:hypothetical protein
MLKDYQRTNLLDWVNKHATDEEILQFVDRVIDREKDEANVLGTVSKYIGVGVVHKKPGEEYVPPVVEEDVKHSKKVVEDDLKPSEEPSGTAAKRIGTATKDAIRGYLRNGPATDEMINKAINGNIGNTKGLLKLLWERKDLKYSEGKFSL